MFRAFGSPDEDKLHVTFPSGHSDRPRGRHRWLFDFRSGSNIQHSTIALLRQSVYSRLAGYEDTNDAERLSVDPVMRHVVGGRAVDRSAASTSQVARFETEMLTDPDNLAALIAIPGRWVDRIRQRRPSRS